MPDQIKKRIRAIDIGGGITVAAIALLTALVVAVPLRHQSQANIARAADLKTQLAEFDALDLTIANAKKELQATHARLSDAESRLPSEGEMAQFMQELARVADDAGLQLDSIGPRSVVPAGDYKAMPVDINGSGDFASCYKFLKGLRHMNRLTRLDDLLLQSVPPTKDTPAKAAPVCTIRVTISTFMAR
jgi:Tfp pilus assembly protein PilO